MSATDCPYCGLIHKAICPRIKRIEYSDHSPGHYKVVEFFAPVDYPSIVARERPRFKITEACAGD